MNNVFDYRKIIDLNGKDVFSIETFANDEMMKLSSCKYDEATETIIDAPFIALDEISRNGSMYDGNMIIESLESPYISELFRRGAFFSELEHPDINCSRERFMTVDKDNICGHVVNWKRTPDNIIAGDFQFLAPKGYIVKDWFNKGINFGWSIRTLTPNYEERRDAQGNPYVYKFKSCRTVSFDTVKIGGFKKASIVSNVDSYDASKVSPRSSTESFDNIHLTSVKTRKKEEFKKLLESQESLPIMEDIYGFSMKDVNDISYSKEGLITINVKRNRHHTTSINIPTNVYKINQILSQN